MISTENVVIWRLQTKAGNGYIGEYCIKKGVVAMGWCYIDKDGEKTKGKVFEKYDDYVRWYEDINGDGSVGGSVSRLVFDVKKDDLVWMRHGGIYYLGRVTGEWEFCSDPEAVKFDACNQRKVNWIKIGNQSDESSVPGAISTSFIRGSTLQRVWKMGVKEYSIIAYDHYNKDKSRVYESVNLDFKSETFFNMLSNNDCEDLVYFYLFYHHHYICIPSSDKIGTPSYEYVMIDTDTGEHVYAQVKQQDDPLDASEKAYKEINGKMFFFNAKGGVINVDNNKKQEVINKEALFEFVISDVSSNIISQSIRNWVRFLSGLDEDGNSISDLDYSGNKKGVMFDTLGEQYETDMLKNNKISAYGKSARYIRSAFDIGDYVFYYSKGKGIVAVGRILSEPFDNDDETYRKVELIYPCNNEIAQSPLSAKDIRGLTNRNYYFASTIKSPFLNSMDSELLLDELKKRNCVE